MLFSEQLLKRCMLAVIDRGCRLARLFNTHLIDTVTTEPYSPSLLHHSRSTARWSSRKLMDQSKAFLQDCLLIILLANLLSLSAERPSHHDPSAIMKPSLTQGLPRAIFFPSLPPKKTSLVRKSTTVHTAFIPSIPGTLNWRVRYIKVVSTLPIQLVAATMENLLHLQTSPKQPQQTSVPALVDILASIAEHPGSEGMSFIWILKIRSGKAE